MHMLTRNSFRLLAALGTALPATAAPTSCKVNGHSHNVDSVITKDFAIIGGGSGGTYSAIRLKDSGKTVVVIEAKDRLGGHTETYIEPNTGAPIDIGVLVFHDYPEVTSYFTRLNVAYSPLSFSGIPGVVDEYIDFSTGKANLTFVPGVTPYAFTQALGAYSAEVFKYPYLDYGYSLPDPVPAELYMPFGDFVKKHSLDAMVNFAWQFTQGVGNILHLPTIYILKSLGIADLVSLQTSFLSTTQHYNSLLYLSAQAILGTDVLYSSKVVDVERNNDGVLLIVKSGDKRILIKAQKLIIAMQPTLNNLKPIDLSDHERRLFKKFKHTQYYTGLLKNTGIPGNVSLNSYSVTLPYNIPHPPAIYLLGQTGFPGLINVHYVDTDHKSDADIEASIIAQIEKVDVPGKTAGAPEFVARSNHKPFQLQVSADDIKDGFYADLLALQGKKRTWYISATMHTHDSSLIWRYAESLLPALLA